MTDIELQHQVARELEWDPRVAASRVGVTAHSGVVTLNGEVGTYLERLAAERATKRVHGVRAVANDLVVTLAKDGQRSDADIALAAVQMLDWTAAVPKGAVKVTVTKGNLRLEGQVGYHFQREAAQRVADHLLGVQSITNMITISPPVVVADIKRRIADAFKRSATVDSRNVQVETAGGTVTLTGKVHSWSEREDAELAAWSAPGVTAVEDRLAVTP